MLVLHYRPTVYNQKDITYSAVTENSRLPNLWKHIPNNMKIQWHSRNDYRIQIQDCCRLLYLREWNVSCSSMYQQRGDTKSTFKGNLQRKHNCSRWYAGPYVYSKFRPWGNISEFQQIDAPRSLGVLSSLADQVPGC